MHIITAGFGGTSGGFSLSNPAPASSAAAPSFGLGGTSLGASSSPAPFSFTLASGSAATPASGAAPAAPPVSGGPHLNSSCHPQCRSSL